MRWLKLPVLRIFHESCCSCFPPADATTLSPSPESLWLRNAKRAIASAYLGRAGTVR